MSGQDCDGAKGQAPIKSLLKSLLVKPLHLMGHLEIESTDHGPIIAVPLSLNAYKTIYQEIFCFYIALGEHE